MPADKIVLVASAYDQADILGDYIEWHLHLGVDFVLVQDCGSTDGSQDVLERFSGNKRVQWFKLPERNMLKYASDVVLAAMARDRYDADWIIQCDPDEFLCLERGNLGTRLREAMKAGFTALSVPCFNMTGPPLKPGQSALRTSTLRIERPVLVSHEQQLSGDLPVPYTFIQHPPKTIVLATAFAEYGPGTHAVTSAWGQSGELAGSRFLHYSIRGFDKLEKKVSNSAAWLKDNPHLQSWPEWGWHWRRWIRLNQAGRLKEDYENQFVSDARAEELIRDGTCMVDMTISNWIEHRN